MQGNVHSFQSLGAVDGPGLRCTLFLQGCPLRCAYCHNPDTWCFGGGTNYSAEEIFTKIMRYKSYISHHGGVTISGGEPLMQAEFIAELFTLLKENGVHTAIDTSGTCDLSKAKIALEKTDLVICDIKFATEEKYQQFSKGSLKQVLNFLDLCKELNVPLWVRHVIVPNLTSDEKEVQKVIDMAVSFPNLKKIELLPFRKICITKYNQMGIDFPLKDTEECDSSTLAKLSALIPPKFR